MSNRLSQETSPCLQQHADNPVECLQSEQRAINFVHGTLWNNGKLLATYKDGKAHLNAYLDDHAFLLNASLELLQAEFRNADFKFATQFAGAMLTRFEDSNNGGFFHQPRP